MKFGSIQTHIVQRNVGSESLDVLEGLRALDRIGFAMRDDAVALPNQTAWKLTILGVAGLQPPYALRLLR